MSDNLAELNKRLDKIVAAGEALTDSLYENETDEAQQEKEIARIEEGFKALSRKLSATEHNRWGYSPSGWLSRKVVSTVLNKTKHGLYSIHPIPCKGRQCPYAPSCIALQNGIQPPYGEPCVIETTKIETAVAGYCEQFEISSSSATDRALLQELVMLDILIDRAMILQSQQGDILQDINFGSTQEGEIYTQPVVSKYLEAYSTLSKRRESILDQMLATRKSRKGIPQENEDDDRRVLDMTDKDENFFYVEERPEKYKEKEE